MNVTSILEIYTTLAGWIFNNIQHDIVMLGFILIPFAFMIVNNIRESITAGSFRSAVEMGVKRVESDFYEMFLVVFCVLIPFFPLQINSITYNAPAADFLSVTIPKKITASNDPTTYSTTLNPTVNDMQSAYGVPEVPIIPYFVMKAAYGANYAMTQAMIDANARNDLQAADYAFSQFGLNDPALAGQLMQFNNDCFQRARSKFVDFSANGNISLLLTGEGRVALKSNPADINSFGSIVFQTTPGLYAQCNNIDLCQRSLHAMRPIEGWPYNQARDGIRLPEQDGLPGQPRCDEWWRDLRTQIIAATPEAQTIWNKIKSNLGVNISNENDVIANRVLRNTFNNDQAKAPATMAGLMAGRNPLQEMHLALTDLGLKFSSFKEGFKTEGVKNAMYILLALALMMFYMNIPAILLFTGFKIKGVIIIAGTLVTLIFAHSILTLVEFMEVAIYNSVYDDRTAFFTSETRIDITVYGYIMKIAYPLVLTFYLIIMSRVVGGAAELGSSLAAGGNRVNPSAPPIPKVPKK